ncbi:MAG: aminomethyl-transferring glycine dehydrogenase subunit GcvPA [Candidatus Kapabacteria bacterium]|nr:aminomethyl-transferring glycine dehydrogenase subunit GcvPA [Candidatus Kapabacteria bacterium]
MVFIPNTDSDRKIMLEKIGINSFDELIEVIPENIRLKNLLNLPAKLSELEVVRLMENYSKMNITAGTHTCFMGGGAYDRFIPTIVDTILERSEFKTAYTPYQAEVSQGTLQVMYEYQSMICALTGMDISNASMYDGGTALAEACLLSGAHNRRNEFLIAGSINPYYKQVINTITSGRKYSFKEFVMADGTADLEALKNAISDKTSGIIAQQPNAFGNLEDVFEIGKIAHSKKAMFIISVDPISLGVLTPPSEYDADIVVGEGQPLGISLNFGGPYLGIFACKKEFVRKIPGRLTGVTVDEDGKRGFVLTLQTREQQIKREKATSNICTNQGLLMLASTVYMATMGKEGIKEVAEQSFQKAHYLAGQITALPGFSLVSEKPFLYEFLVQTPVAVSEIICEAKKVGILAGIEVNESESLNGLLIAVTEKRTREDLDNFVNFLKRFGNNG